MKIRILFFVFGTLLLCANYTDEYDDLFDDIDYEMTGDSAGEGEADSLLTPADQFTLDILGKQEFQLRVPVIPDYFDLEGDIKKPRYLTTLEAEGERENVRFVSNWEMEILINENSRAAMFSSPLLLPLENYLQIKLGKFRLNSGLIKYNWGRGDGLNPTDKLNPQDLRTGDFNAKWPLLSLSCDYYPANFLSLSLVYAPFEQSDLTPVFAGDEMAAAFPAATVTETATEYDLETFLLGGKLDFRLAALDFSFSYIYNMDSYFSPRMEFGETDYSAAFSLPPGSLYFTEVDTIRLEKKRVHNIGFDFRSALGFTGIWGEACFTLPAVYRRYQVREAELAWICGLDFSVGINDEYYFNFQYFGRYIPGFDDSFYTDYEDGIAPVEVLSDPDDAEDFYYRSIINQLGGITEGWLNGFSLRQELKTPDASLLFSLGSIYTLPALYEKAEDKTRLGSLILQPQLDWTVYDSVHLKIGADLNFAWYKQAGKIKLDEADLIGMNYRHSNVYLIVSHAWNLSF